MIKTFVLVLMVSYSSDGAISTVPGYTSREACVSAGDDWTKQLGWLSMGRYQCIPGPDHDAATGTLH